VPRRAARPLDGTASALLQHRQEVSKHREWLFGAMESVAREREANVYSVAFEGDKLDAPRRAAEQLQKNAAYERAVVSKERAALSEHQKALSEQREEVNHEKPVLASTAAQLAAQREAVEAVAKETVETRAQLTALAHATAHEAQAVEQRQRLLHEEAEKLLKPPTPPPMVPTTTRGGTPRQFSTIGNPYEALGRANYTTTALSWARAPQAYLKINCPTWMQRRARPWSCSTSNRRVRSRVSPWRHPPRRPPRGLQWAVRMWHLSLSLRPWVMTVLTSPARRPTIPNNPHTSTLETCRRGLIKALTASSTRVFNAWKCCPMACSCLLLWT
jgi:hypothetical protein